MVRLYYSTDPEILFKEALGLYTQHPSPITNDYSKILYLTPSPLRAKSATKIFHRLLNPGKGNICYIPPEITSLPELLRRLNSLYGFNTLISSPVRPILISRVSGKGMGFSILLSELIRDLKGFHPERDIEELKESIIAVMNELNIPDSLKDSIIECLEIFRRYQGSLIRNGLIDMDDLLRLCPSYIKHNMNFSVAIIDGFYAPTRAEMLIIKAIIERAGYSLVSIPFVDGLEGVIKDYLTFLRENFDIEVQETSKSYRLDFTFHPCDDIETEVEGIARHIKSQFVAGRIEDLSDVLVAFPDPDKYREITERVFYRYGIPFNCSRKKSLAESRPIIDLFCMIQSVCEDYPRLRFSQFLSSRYFRKIPETMRAWIPYLSLQSGIISGKRAWLGFLSNGNERCDIKRIINDLTIPESEGLFRDPLSIEGLRYIKRDLQYIFEKLTPLEEIKEVSSLSTFSATIKDVLKELGFLDFTPVDEGYRTYSDMRRHFLDRLEELASLEGLVPSGLSLQEFSEYLWHILNNTYIETDSEGVTVTDIPGAFSLSFRKHMYVGGLTDEDMPGRSIDYILPDSVKRGIGLPDLERRITLQKFLLENIIRSSANIHLSYPVSEDEKRFLPSPFLYSGRPEKERVPGIFSKEELLLADGERPLKEFLTEIKIRSGMLNLNGMLNVTDVDAYRSCPRRFFIERVLNLLPPSIKEYDLEAATLGEIIHRVMEKIIFEPFNDMDRLRERAGDIVDEVTGGKNIDPFWKGIIKDTFLEILPEIVLQESKIRDEGYLPFRVEEKVTGEPVKGIRLKGKIDRIDRSEKGLSIIDYKTGSETITCSRVLDGREKLQLFLYAALLNLQGHRVDRVGIYSLKDIRIKWCPSKKRGKGKSAEEGMDEMIGASLGFLKETVRDLRSGVFTARPFDDNYFQCRWCHENPLCPYIQS